MQLGLRSSIGVDLAGKAYGFGQNDGFELQFAGAKTAIPRPMTIPATAIVTELGSQLGAYLDAAGALWTWGMGNSPMPQMLASGPYDQLDVGYSYGCVRATVDGHLECWGDNYRGNLANGSQADLITPMTVMGGLGAVESFVTAAWVTCAIGADHSLWCWGDNMDGISGTNNADFLTPITQATQVGTDLDWRVVGLGADNGCAIKQDYTLWCWGQGYYNTTTMTNPAPVKSGAATDWAFVESANQHTCARKTNGEVYCWGSNAKGDLGRPGGDAVAPTRVTLPFAATELVVGGFDACARGTGTGWWCWGGNDSGQLGIGNYDNQFTPIERCPQ